MYASDMVQHICTTDMVQRIFTMDMVQHMDTKNMLHKMCYRITLMRRNAALILGRRPDEDFAPAEIDGMM